MRAEDIERALVELDQSINNLRGQGYDGASVMSGERSGVQKRILDHEPKALYTHCPGHSLNLVIAQGWHRQTMRYDGGQDLYYPGKEEVLACPCPEQ